MTVIEQLIKTMHSMSDSTITSLILLCEFTEAEINAEIDRVMTVDEWNGFVLGFWVPTWAVRAYGVELLVARRYGFKEKWGQSREEIEIELKERMLNGTEEELKAASIETLWEILNMNNHSVANLLVDQSKLRPTTRLMFARPNDRATGLYVIELPLQSNAETIDQIQTLLTGHFPLGDFKAEPLDKIRSN